MRIRVDVVSHLALVALMELPVGAALRAQDGPPRERRIEVWGGLAVGSPSWGLLGATEFIVDVIPVARISTSYVSLRGTGQPCPPDRLCVQAQFGDGALFFTAAIEAGVRLALPAGHPTIMLRYRLHHISNAGTGRENPGVASHFFTIGLTARAQPAHN